jgi:hypothetical protein
MGSHNILIESFDLQQAAVFLNMHPDSLQRKAAAGEIPGAKIGKNWVFINIHLAQMISDQYASNRQKRESADGKENEEWHLKKDQEVGGMSISQPQVDKEYDNLLGLETNSKHKNTMIG